MDYKEFCDQLQAWSCNEPYHTRYVAIVDGKKKKMRLFYSATHECPCRYRKGSKRYGQRMYPSEVAAISAFYPDVPDQTVKLQKACKRCAELLEKSGLWADMLPAFKAVMRASYNDVKELINLPYGKEVEWFKQRGAEHRISPDEIYGLINKGVISIPYDKYERDFVKGMLKNAISSRERYSHCWRSNYDHSVSTQVGDDGIFRGWYSAEFKNCGNGHYYLMLDESHAFHCEDD